MDDRAAGWLTLPGPSTTDDGFACWPIHEVIDEGLLWLINRVVFHPAGRRLIYYHDTDGTPVGFSVEDLGFEIHYPPEVDTDMDMLLDWADLDTDSDGFSDAEEAGDADLRFESRGVTIFVDPESLPMIDGTEVDFVKDGLNEAFRFRNPNISGECGCGESFSV